MVSIPRRPCLTVIPYQKSMLKTRAPQLSEVAPLDSLDVWILAGQSNMDGIGLLSEALQPDERVFAFTSAGVWETATDPLVRHWESFTRANRLPYEEWLAAMKSENPEQYERAVKAQSTNGAGLGISFGKAMADATGKPVGLIPASHGGTSLTQWSYEDKAKGDESLYGALLERVRRAGGNLRGVLWYQGESDAGLADTYGTRFERWLAELRGDLCNPTLPLVAVQLGRCTLYDAANKQEVGRNWDLVRRAQYELPDTVPNTGVTSAIDLGLSDAIHLSASAQIRLGKRMARCMLGIEKNYSGPRVTGIEQIPSGSDFGIVRIKTKGVAARWFPADNIVGFGLYTPSGDEHPVNHVFNAAPDRSDPTSLIVKTNLPIGSGDILGYGIGMSPSCNAVDKDDMPLCAFEWKF